MRISFVIIIFAFLQYTVFSQEWNIYSNIDSLGNIIKPYDYITENEINEIFDVISFRIEEFAFENMSLLPMQLVSNDKIRFERVPFYEDQFSEISDLYQKWVNPRGETFKMIKTTFAPDGSIIHVKPKF